MSVPSARLEHGSNRAAITINKWAFILLLILTISVLSPNEALTLFSLATLTVIYLLLHRSGEPPVLLIAIGIQWLQVSMTVIDANFHGLNVNDHAQSWRGEDAVWLSLTGIVVLTCGIRMSWFGMAKIENERLNQEVAGASTRKLFYLYLMALAFGVFVAELLWRIPGFFQIGLRLIDVKWIVLFSLAYVVIRQRNGYLMLGTAIVFELIIGITGFFADYQTILLVLIVALWSAGVRIKRTRVLGLILSASILLYLAIVWSAVKSEYRTFVNLGTNKQTVLVGFYERAQKISGLHEDMDYDDYARGVEALIDRVSYTKYFSYVLEYVPYTVPHEGGKLWKEAILHVVTPRLLFPDKSSLPWDTEVTERYTGLRLIEQGGFHTTVPLGYMVESYIDFGTVFMFVPIFFVGCLWGLMYRTLLRSTSHLIFGFGACVALMLNIQLYEIAAAKLLGGMLTGFAVLLVVCHFIVPYCSKYVMKSSQ